MNYFRSVFVNKSAGMQKQLMHGELSFRASVLNCLSCPIRGEMHTKNNYAQETRKHFQWARIWCVCCMMMHWIYRSSWDNRASHTVCVGLSVSVTIMKQKQRRTHHSEMSEEKKDEKKNGRKNVERETRKQHQRRKSAQQRSRERESFKNNEKDTAMTCHYIHSATQHICISLVISIYCFVHIFIVGILSSTLSVFNMHMQFQCASTNLLTSAASNTFSLLHDQETWTTTTERRKKN